MVQGKRQWFYLYSDWTKHLYLQRYELKREKKVPVPLVGASYLYYVFETSITIIWLCWPIVKLVSLASILAVGTRRSLPVNTRTQGLTYELYIRPLSSPVEWKYSYSSGPNSGLLHASIGTKVFAIVTKLGYGWISVQKICMDNK